MKAVLDANVLISAVLAPVGAPTQVLRPWLDGAYEPPPRLDPKSGDAHLLARARALPVVAGGLASQAQRGRA